MSWKRLPLPRASATLDGTMQGELSRGLDFELDEMIKALEPNDANESELCDRVNLGIWKMTIEDRVLMRLRKLKTFFKLYGFSEEYNRAIKLVSKALGSIEKDLVKAKKGQDPPVDEHDLHFPRLKKP